MKNDKDYNQLKPTPESIKYMQEKCIKDLNIKISKKDTVTILKNAKKLSEAEKHLDTAIHGLHLSKNEIADFRKIYEKEYGSTKEYSDYKMNEIASKISVISTLQSHRIAGKKMQSTLIKYLKIKINNEDKEKLKKLFSLAFNIKLANQQIKYYLTLSQWFVWYEEGLDYSLSKALDNLLVHYDKKKRGKKGSLKPDDYELGYFYRWIDYSLNKLKDRNTLLNKNHTQMSLPTFLKWMDNKFGDIHSFINGDEYKHDKNGKFTLKIKLDSWA